MNKIISVIGVFLLIGCGKSDQQKLSLFNNVTFQIKNYEKIQPLSPPVSDTYKSHLQNIDAQIPLFRLIEGDHYRIYLGIPFNVSFDDLSNDHLMDSTYLSKEVYDEANYYKLYKTDSNFIIAYGTRLNENILHLLATTTSEQVVDTLLNPQLISNRIEK